MRYTGATASNSAALQLNRAFGRAGRFPYPGAPCLAATGAISPSRACREGSEYSGRRDAAYDSSASPPRPRYMPYPMTIKVIPPT